MVSIEFLSWLGAITYEEHLEITNLQLKTDNNSFLACLQEDKTERFHRKAVFRAPLSSVGETDILDKPGWRRRTFLPA